MGQFSKVPMLMAMHPQPPRGTWTPDYFHCIFKFQSVFLIKPVSAKLPQEVVLHIAQTPCKHIATSQLVFELSARDFRQICYLQFTYICRYQVHIGI